YQKEESTGLIRPEIESLLKVSVNRNEIKAIIQGHEHAHDEPVAEEVSDHDLEVAEFGFGDVARNADKSNARQRSADHSKGNEVPGRLSVCREKCIGICSTRRDNGYGNQYSEIDDHYGDDESRTHAAFLMLSK